MAGLEPRGFKWVIAGRLAVSERIGGYGFQHRRVRREEEIIWLAEQGINTVLSLLSSNQNQAAYEAAGFRYFQFPLEATPEPEDLKAIFETFDEALDRTDASVLVHRDLHVGHPGDRRPGSRTRGSLDDPQPVTRVAIGLGSNLGDRVAHVDGAIAELKALGTAVGVSSLYETEPIGGPEQDAFINAVAVIDTELEPRQLLDALIEIERRHGRIRRERWGPRTLDLDILVFEGRTIDEPGLTVPHPHIAERRFVLEPLAEVWPDAEIEQAMSAQRAVERVLDQEVARFHRNEPQTGDEAEVAGWQVFAVTMGLALAFWWLVDWIL